MTNSIVLRPHRRLERNGVIALELTSGPYQGIIFSYGAVKFEENTELDHLRVKFEYNIHDVEPDDLDKVAFEKELGDFLLEIILYQMEEKSLIYKGGIDEIREDNIIELDP
jgi:hypothetical protein